MKKFLALVITLFFTLPVLSGQRSLFNMGDKLLGLGLGVGSTLYASGTGYSTGVPPLTLSYEQAVVDRIFKKGVLGVGAYVGYSLFKSRFTVDEVTFGWNYHNFIVGAGALLHYPFIDKLDTYAGAGIAYNFTTAGEYGDPGTYSPVSTGGIVVSGFVGEQAHDLVHEEGIAVCRCMQGCRQLAAGLATG